MEHNAVDDASPFCRDGRFLLGDEIVNVAGCSLRGLAMEEARAVLRGCQGEVDLILGNTNISWTYRDISYY